jgi:peptidoglycan-associated lipoprotein
LYYSKRNSDGTFEEPQLMNLFQDTAKFNVGQPSLSSDGYKLYFSASVPHKGYGGKDIYVCERINDQWSIPENLGPEINTPGDESFPFAYKDDMLYFSSNGHIGMGGMDVYEARKKGRKWEIRNMQYPLNTGADDFGLVLQDTEILSESGYYVTRGFFSSSRKDGLGSDDIYGLRMRKDAFYFLNVVVLEKVLMNPDDPKSKVIDLAPVRNTKVQIYANDTLVEIGKTNESGILR